MNKVVTCLGVLTCLVFASTGLSAQSETGQATRSGKLQELSEKLRQRDRADKSRVLSAAQKMGIASRRELPNGRILELQRIVPGIGPIFYVTNNVDAADTVSTDEVWPGGSAGLDLDGSGMNLGEWDGGAVFDQHPDFTGRLTQADGATSVSNHSTHVAGTLVGSGEWLLPESRGMAYEAHLDAYDWNSDTAEMAAAAANGLLLSNHSYGIAAGWLYTGALLPPDTWWWIGGPDPADVEDPNFGYYDSETQLWDQIAYDAPYYLIVKAAGNDRSDIGPVTGEEYTVIDQEGNFLFTSDLPRNADCAPAGYDCVPGSGVAKNVLTVGAVDDLIGGYSKFSGPSSVQMAGFSGWGPTDDGRIKPDLVGNGVFLLSAWGDDPYYAAAAGTSMATPNVTGSLVLLQELYNPNPVPASYAPDMMSYDGASGYTRGFSSSGNAVTTIARFTASPHVNADTLYGIRYIMRLDYNGTPNQRGSVFTYAMDNADSSRAGKLGFIVRDNANATVCLLVTKNTFNDGLPHTVFASYDATAGTAILIVDGQDEDMTVEEGFAGRVLKTGTLPTGASTAGVGINENASNSHWDEDIGFIGHSNTYLTNWSDFMEGDGTPKEIDEVAWTQWGAQPLFWNKDGMMTDNKGSAGNMIKNGTITPVIYPDIYSTDGYMRAATLKALAIHTADEAGDSDGPDYEFGWGLLNTKSAALVITNSSGNHQIIESSLADGLVDTIEIAVTDPDSRVSATLVWTDPPGIPVAPSLDPQDIMLVNDLDLRIEKGPSTFMPWVLDPASPAAAATTGDNIRDNVEQVVVDSGGSGSYFVKVSHKGTLLNSDDQPYSLIISEFPPPPTGSVLLVDENFSSGLPGDWAVDTSSGISWTINTPVPGDNRLDNLTGGQGNFAMVDNGYSHKTVTSLEMPEFDLSSATAVVLRFNSYFAMDTSESINVDISTDGGSNWSNVWQWMGFNPEPTAYVLDLSGQATGQSRVSLRFRFDSEYETQGNLWQIDNVQLEVFGIASPPVDTPDPATAPTPADGAVDVDVESDLAWTAGANTTSHEVYFGTNPAPGPAEWKGSQGGTTYDPGTLANDTTYYWRIDEVNGDGTTEGSVWSFTAEVAVPVPPGLASAPVPADGTTGHGLDTDISWTAGALATSHEVYFGTNPAPGPAESKGSQGGTTYDPGTLANNTTYYWRIDEVNDEGTTEGLVWSFTTETYVPAPPGQAANPTPADGASNQNLDVVVNWTAGALAESHDVFFGINPAPGPGEFQGNHAGTAFNPGTLVNDTTYYWRIDEVNGDGTTEGPVWSFTTESPAQSTELHLSNITPSSIPGSRGKWTASVQVEVMLGTGVAMQNVQVNGNWSNGARGGSSCVTNSSGLCVVEKSSLKSNVASVVFTVTDLVATGYTYDETANKVDSAITVLKDGGTADRDPVAEDDSYDTLVDTPVSENVMSNDDPGTASATVSGFDANSAAGGTVSMAGNGDFTYTPKAGFAGTDTFTYTITDSNNVSDSATVTITISEAPSGFNLTAVARRAKGTTFVDLSWSGGLGTGQVSVSHNVSGTLTAATDNDGAFTHELGKKASGTHTYTVCELDNGGTCTSDSVQF